MQVYLRNLTQADAAALLRFELDNRAWFERHVAPRDPGFYSPAGVAAHIDSCLGPGDGGHWHACLVIGADGAIVGRANLKHIDPSAGTAEAGYRIGQRHAGQGYATLAVRHLQALAWEQWQLQQLYAFVTDANVASARVLLRCGFSQGQHQPRLALLNGQWQDGHRYDCALVPGRADRPVSSQ